MLRAVRVYSIFRGPLLPSQNRLLQGMILFFNGVIEQWIFPIVQLGINFCPIFRAQSLNGSRKQQPFFLIHVLVLMLDEVDDDIMESLSQEFPACQDVFDGLSKPKQMFGFNFMLGFDVADAMGYSRISHFQLFVNNVLFRMMVALGIVLKVLYDRLKNFVIRSIAVIEYFYFLFQNMKQLFDVSMLFEQDFDRFW